MCLSKIQLYFIYLLIFVAFHIQVYEYRHLVDKYSNWRKNSQVVKI